MYEMYSDYENRLEEFEAYIEELKAQLREYEILVKEKNYQISKLMEEIAIMQGKNIPFKSHEQTRGPPSGLVSAPPAYDVKVSVQQRQKATPNSGSVLTAKPVPVQSHKKKGSSHRELPPTHPFYKGPNQQAKKAGPLSHSPPPPPPPTRTPPKNNPPPQPTRSPSMNSPPPQSSNKQPPHLLSSSPPRSPPMQPPNLRPPQIAVPQQQLPQINIPQHQQSYAAPPQAQYSEKPQYDPNYVPRPSATYSHSTGILTRICPQCNAMGFAIKEVEDKSQILSYIPKRIYAKKKVCTKCFYEFK
ncbi:MAG: hypothetical protein ACFE8P_05050 [Promethearchaeota archaeon]